MNLIHKTALVSEDANIAENVSIGPYSIIGPEVLIGENSVIDSHVVIKGKTTIGSENHIYSFTSIVSHCLHQHLPYTPLCPHAIISIRQHPKRILRITAKNPGTTLDVKHRPLVAVGARLSIERCGKIVEVI